MALTINEMLAKLSEVEGIHEEPMMKVGDRIIYDDTSMHAMAGVDCFEGVVEAIDGETILVRRVKIVSETNFMKADVVRVMTTSTYVTVIEEATGFDAQAHRDFMRSL